MPPHLLHPGPSFETSFEANRPCPNCPSRGLTIFYTVRNIPAHSCLLMPSRAEAVDYPRGDLRLGFCPACGFITNTAFDPTLNEYSQRYEETQGFSPTFNRFAEQLAKRYVDRYNLADKTILEIGCGKGEYLIQTLEIAGPKARGIGIDPGYIPSRTTSPAAKQAEFIVDLYDRRYAHLKADFIVCRHTLEHIAPTREFMQELRATIGDRPETALFFELPDVMRELREGAFWDLYYEHCTYFSCGSLARLFRSTGFDVTHLSLEYDGQYIILDALPAPGPTAPRLPLENDLAELADRVSRFAQTCSAVVRRWRDILDEGRRRGERTVIWGSGSKGVSFLTTLGVTHDDGAVAAAVDINPFRHGRFMPGSGHEIIPPEALASLRPDRVIVMNPVYVPEITDQLSSMGLRPEVLAL